MAYTSGRSPVFLVGLVYSVCLVCLVEPERPDRSNRLDRPNEWGVRPGGVLEVCGGHVRDRMGHG